MLPENVRRYFSGEVLQEIRDFFERVDTENFQDFICTASSGLMYEEIAEAANSRIENLSTPLDRNSTKTLMFYMLFSSNQGQHDNPTINQMKQCFEYELYPQVAELFRIIKRRHRGIDQPKQHNRLSVLLQAIESHIILHRCCRRIWEEANHQVPIFTIHDSIVTTSECEEYVREVMMQEITACIGVPPTLDPEVWSLSNASLDQNILVRAQAGHI
jgi:hypothetical protein